MTVSSIPRSPDAADVEDPVTAVADGTVAGVVAASAAESIAAAVAIAVEGAVVVVVAGSTATAVAAVVGRKGAAAFAAAIVDDDRCRRACRGLHFCGLCRCGDLHAPRSPSLTAPSLELAAKAWLSAPSGRLWSSSTLIRSCLSSPREL